ncbi:putative J domain-containing protein [Lachnellula suecica]|uniref:Putative J domain-containing protein n=1 Tax=Lachnellula suecica TaxID=602035 RepID=A0A8T9BTH8_9HELO|nr:putative J domain-containing protein [Lachnellula suecica]
MRLSFFTVAVLAVFIAVVAAWSKEDQEIFRLRDEVELSEGPDTSFYDFLDIKPSANQEEINKAYRKKSRLLHPDKVKQQFIAEKSTGKGKPKSKKPGVHVSSGPSKSEINAAAKAASDRFARLGIVTNILRGAGRERYDHFLSNGFPKWKGTGYYYARFRPGLGSVLAGLFIFVGGGGHWLALYMSWKRQQEFVGRYIKFARHAAWGDNLGIPGLDAPAATPAASGSDEADAMAQPVNRKMRRMQEKDAKKGDKSVKKTKGIKAAKASPAGTPPVNATGPRKRVVAENGKTLVVDSVGNVYLEQANEEGEIQEFLLDPNELAPPTLKDTALYRVPIWAFDRLAGKFLRKAPSFTEEDEEEEEVASSSSSRRDDFEVLEKVKTTAQNGNGKTSKKSKKSARGR